MLGQIDRRFVQMVRYARAIRITVNAGCEDELSLVFDEKRGSIRKLTHDVALAVQDHSTRRRGK